VPFCPHRAGHRLKCVVFRTDEVMVERAISQAAAFLYDPQGMRAVLDAIDWLADDPSGPTKTASSDLTW
jgi:hypothetical protein